MSAAAPVPLCAICAKHPGVVSEPIGLRDRMVPVCTRCATEVPCESHGIERGFEPSGSASLSKRYELPAGIPHLPFHEIGPCGHRSAMRAINLTDDNRDERELSSALEMVRDPKARLFRVARLDEAGRSRTFQDCLAIAEAQDWYLSTAYYNSDARWYVWQEVV